MKIHSKLPRPGLASAMAFNPAYVEIFPFLEQAKGVFIVEMNDAATGETLTYFEKPNIITRDAGILVARLLKNSNSPNANTNNGLRMLAVGTGATGAILSPDAAQATQRKLNTELARKAFSSTTFRDSDGNAVAYPTNIVDFSTTFTTSEAVGALNEMALIAPYSSNPATTNPINNGPSEYDDTIDVSSKDLLLNYVTFAVVSKPNTATLTISYRITC